MDQFPSSVWIRFWAAGSGDIDLDAGLRVGAGIGAVKDLAGRSSLAVTNRYVHALAGDLKDAVRKGFGGGD